uniref:Tachykinin precursor 4 n=1 Tax=Canis lupus dingo TaxID=286419 RepID=A0A8C0LFT8_CANLU
MLLCVPLLLLMGLSACTGTAAEDLAVGAEAGSWITLTLEDGGIPGIQLQLQLQEVKRGKASQFFGLMGKRVGGDDQMPCCQFPWWGPGSQPARAGSPQAIRQMSGRREQLRRREVVPLVIQI